MALHDFEIEKMRAGGFEVVTKYISKLVRRSNGIVGNGTDNASPSSWKQAYLLRPKSECPKP